MAKTKVKTKKIAQPYPPYAPTKPYENLPSTTRVTCGTYDPTDVPEGSTKVSVDVSGSSSYGYEIELTFTHGEKPNPDYVKQLEKYNRDLKNYNKAKQIYDTQLKAYNEQQAKAAEANDLKEFERLSKKFEKLKAKLGK